MRRMDFLRGGAVALAGAMAGSTIMVSARPAASHPVIPNTPVFDQSGRRLHFYDDLIHGKAVLLNFFYTSCGDTCPLVTQNLREVQDILGPRMGQDIHMVSVTLQPELETPEILRDYVGLWDIRPGWTFLTGRPEWLDIGITYGLLNLIATLATLKFFRHGDLAYDVDDEETR